MASQYKVKNEITTMREMSSKGVVGNTLMPNAEHEPSPDDNVNIYVSNKLSNVDMVSNQARINFQSRIK